MNVKFNIEESREWERFSSYVFFFNNNENSI